MLAMSSTRAQPLVRRHLGVDLAESLVLQAVLRPSASRVTPGATALQRIPCAPYWQAMWVVSAVRPPLAAE